MIRCERLTVNFEGFAAVGFKHRECANGSWCGRSHSRPMLVLTNTKQDTLVILTRDGEAVQKAIRRANHGLSVSSTDTVEAYTHLAAAAVVNEDEGVATGLFVC